MLVEAAIVVLVAIGIAYISIAYFQKKPSHQGAKEWYDIEAGEQKVLSHTDLPWITAPCSLRFLIFLEHAPRTLAKVDCLQSVATSSEVNEFKPSCADNSFRRCQCATKDASGNFGKGNNCDNCKLEDKGYMFKMLSKGDLLQLWLSGYTSENDKSKVDALLKVRTAKTSGEHYMESVELPAIPLQKWVMITVVKEGRRFDVYYGAKLVSSSLTDFVPAASADSSLAWMAGNTRWKGKLGYFVGVQKSQTSQDVLHDAESMLDTRGTPLAYESMKMEFSLSMPECLFGQCNKFPQVKPLNPFAVYASSVS